MHILSYGKINGLLKANMIGPERQISFPNATSKENIVKHLEFFTTGEYFVSLIEINPFSSPGRCEVCVGRRTHSFPSNLLVYELETINRGRRMVAIILAELQKGYSHEDAFEYAQTKLMFDEPFYSELSGFFTVKV